MVAAVSRGEARVPKYPTPPVVGHPISPATARELTRLLEGVVIDGTGKSAAVPGYRVAGKTGTAQIPVRGGYRGYLPSFVGFAPADRPALVGLVAIAEPQGSEYYGAQVAAPAFSAIARQVLLYRGIHPERPRPSVWMGQVTMLAGLSGGSPVGSPAAAPAAPRPALAADDVLADGDDHAVTVETPEPESDHAAPKGGRSHASL
jgi:membrane peptidoglycan carboxypeptidase